MHFRRVVLLALGTLIPHFASAESGCNPLTNGTNICLPNIAAPEKYFIDFTKVSNQPSEWTVSNYATVDYGTHGAEFTFRKRFDAPQMWTNFYVLFGRIDVVAQAMPGIGMISSSVLMSDDFDEIDWEWSGNNFGDTGSQGKVQTNYFGKGVIGSYDRSTFVDVMEPAARFHTYSVDWTRDRIIWLVDDQIVRTFYARDADNGAHQFSQTPARLQLGIWDGGDQDTGWGTVQWAGGYTDLTKAPFTMYVQRVSIQNYSPGAAYNYTDTSGSLQSIQILDNYTPPSKKDTSTPRTSLCEQVKTNSSLSAAPTWTVSGTTPYCYTWHVVESGDACSTIEKTYGISDADFRSWNPGLDDNCYNILSGIAYCVCGGTAPLPASTTSSSASSSSIEITSLATTVESASPTSPDTTSSLPSSTSAYSESQSSTTATLLVPSVSSTISGSEMSTTDTSLLPSSTRTFSDAEASTTANTLLSSSTDDISGSQSSTATTSSSSSSTKASPEAQTSSSTTMDVPSSTSTDTSALDTSTSRSPPPVVTADTSQFSTSQQITVQDTATAPIFTLESSPLSSSTSTTYADTSTDPGLSSTVSSTATSTTSSAALVIPFGEATAQTSNQATSAFSCPASDKKIYTSPCGATYSIECHQDRYGGDFITNPHWTKTFEACMNTCSGSGNCVGISYGPRPAGQKGPCYLKKKSQKVVANRNIWGAKRESACSKPKFARRV